MPDSGAGQPGMSWQAYAELHASFKRDLGESEARIISRIDGHAEHASRVEDRVRKLENETVAELRVEIARIRTIGSVLVAASTILSSAVGFAGFLYSIYKAGAAAGH